MTLTLKNTNFINSIHLISILEIRLLCIFFPEMSIYKRCSDKTKCMYFDKSCKNF